MYETVTWRQKTKEECSRRRLVKSRREGTTHSLAWENINKNRVQRGFGTFDYQRRGKAYETGTGFRAGVLCTEEDLVDLCHITLKFLGIS